MPKTPEYFSSNSALVYESKRSSENLGHSSPQTRASLQDPVPYEVVFYAVHADEIMKRLQGAFLEALRDVQRRTPTRGSARIIPLAVR